MKKILYMTVVLAFLSIWCSTGFTLESWYEGVITNKTESTITVNRKTYRIDSNTVIKDNHDNRLSFDALGQESCCNDIKFFATDGYVREIIVDTDKAVW